MAIIMAQEKKLNNIWCWLYIIISITPFIFWEELLIALSSDEQLVLSTLMGLAVAIVFDILDRRAMSNAGFSAPHPLWGIFLPPVYFYKRANITGTRRKCMFWIVTTICIVSTLIIFVVIIFYIFAAIHVELSVCEFLNARTEQKYGQAGLDIHACESVVFNVTDYADDSPFHTEVHLRNGETIQMDVQISPDGNLSIISPYPW